MKLLGSITRLGLIAAAPSKDGDPVEALKRAEDIRQTNMRTQIQHWEMGVAASDEISRKFLERSGNGADSLSPRSFDHSLLRFKLLMGMMVWTHQELGIKFHDNLPELGLHLTDKELIEGIGFADNIAHNSENELYAEMVMEHYHGYGCHCMPSHAHFVMTGGQGPPQDILDVNCQLLRTCYSCAQIENESCDAHNSTYTYDLQHTVGFFDDIISCRDEEGSCSRRTCECDKHFAIHAAERFRQEWNKTKHGLDFNRSTECVKHEGKGPKFSNDCERRDHKIEIVTGLIGMHHHETTAAAQTTSTTTTTTTSTTTTTKNPDWHTHAGAPEGHVHTTRARN